MFHAVKMKLKNVQFVTTHNYSYPVNSPIYDAVWSQYSKAKLSSIHWKMSVGKSNISLVNFWLIESFLSSEVV